MKWAALILIFLCGCYNYRKAANQFGRASISYPEIPAQYCSVAYPVKEKIIQGKDSIKTDTLFVGGGEIIFDTVYKKDSVFFYTTERLPGKVITNTIFKTDTIIRENKAALALCDIERGKAIRLLESKTAESDKWRRIAKKRFWIIVGMGLFIAIQIYGLLRNKIFKHGSK